MAQIVFGGRDYYSESQDDRQPSITGDRQGGRRIQRTFYVESGNGEGEAAHLRAERAIGEMFPPFSIPGRYPTRAPFFVENFSIKGIGASIGCSFGIAIYGAYRIDVTYSGLPFDPEEQQAEGATNPLRYASVSVDSGGDYQVLPEGSLFFEGGVRVPDNVGGSIVFAPRNTYRVTKHLVRFVDIPWTLINKNKGRINASSFPDNNPFFPGVERGTLLFMGMTLDSSVNLVGQKEHSYSLTFIEFFREHKDPQGVEGKLGWNYLFDVKTKTYREIYRDAAGDDPVYKEFPTSDIVRMIGNE